MDSQIVVLLTELVEYFRMFLVLFGLMSMFVAVAYVVGR